jgi:hypothetical protein
LCETGEGGSEIGAIMTYIHRNRSLSYSYSYSSVATHAAHSIKGEKKRNYFIRWSERKHPLHPVAIERYNHNLYRTSSKLKLGGVFGSYEKRL